jgi:hypothetical protein
MKKITSITLLFLGILISAETKAQLQFENTFGLLVNDPSGITVLRGTVALNNLIPVADNKENKFNLGVYYTTEMCCVFTSKVPKKQSEGTVRDLVGLNFRLFNRLSIFGGLGLFRDGLLNEDDFEMVRKEIGFSYQIPKYNMTISTSYGAKKGPSLNVGYFVPINKSNNISPK